MCTQFIRVRVFGCLGWSMLTLKICWWCRWLFTVVDLNKHWKKHSESKDARYCYCMLSIQQSRWTNTSIPNMHAACNIATSATSDDFFFVCLCSHRWCNNRIVSTHTLALLAIAQCVLLTRAPPSLYTQLHLQRPVVCISSCSPNQDYRLPCLKFNYLAKSSYLPSLAGD